MHYAARLGGEGYGTTYEYMAKGWLLMRTKSLLGCDGIDKMLILGLPQRYGLSLDFLFWAEYLQVSEVVVFNTEDDRTEAFLYGRQWLLEHGKLKDIPIRVLKKWEDLSGLDLSTFLVVCESLSSWNEEKRMYTNELYNQARCGFCFVPNDYNEAHRRMTHLPTIKENKLDDYLSNIKFDRYLDCPPVPSGFEFPTSWRDKNNVSFTWKDKFIYFILAVWLRLDEAILSKSPFYRRIAHVYMVGVGGIICLS